MPKNLVNWAVVGVIAFVLLKHSGVNLNFDTVLSFLKGGGATPTAEEFPGKPSNSVILTAVQPIANILSDADKSDKVALARLWRETADVISWDDSVIKTTADIRRANGAAGRLMHLESKGKYSNLGETLDKATIQVLGNKAVPLDAVSRAKAADLFRGLSWAALQ